MPARPLDFYQNPAANELNRKKTSQFSSSNTFHAQARDKLEVLRYMPVESNKE